MDMCYEFAIFLLNKPVVALAVSPVGHEIKAGAQDALF